MKNKRILWVEPYSFGPILENLLALGSVTITPTLELATLELSRAPFDLVVCELCLPLCWVDFIAGRRTQGPAALDFINSLKASCPDLPVLVLTQMADMDTIARAKEIVGDGQVLHKPIMPQEVYRVAHQLLSGGGDGA